MASTIIAGRSLHQPLTDYWHRQDLPLFAAILPLFCCPRPFLLLESPLFKPPDQGYGAQVMVREQYETKWKDYYEILQVHPKAESEVIAAAYRRLALMYHPDKNRSPGAEAKFKEMNEANEVLSDPERRGTYDLVHIRVKAGKNEQESYDRPYQESHHEDTRWSYDSDQSHGDDTSWYHEEEEWQTQPAPHHSHEAQTDTVFSFAFLKYLISSLVDRFAPNPDESQRILPWPSWRWQRVWLLAAPPLAGLLILFTLFSGVWATVVFPVGFLATSIYSGKMTGWLRDTRQAPQVARFLGGASISLSGISWVLGIAYLIFALVMMVFVVIVMRVMFRAMLEEGLNKYR